MNEGTASISNDSEISDCVSASTYDRRKAKLSHTVDPEGGDRTFSTSI